MPKVYVVFVSPNVCPPTPPWDAPATEYPPGARVLRGLVAMPPEIVYHSEEVRAQKVAARLDALRTTAWTDHDDAVTHAPYSTMTQFDPTQDRGSAQANAAWKATCAKASKDWECVENRSSPPDSFSGSVHFRTEPINVKFMLDFMSRTACRRAHHSQRGGLFDQLNILIQRCKFPFNGKDDGIRNIVVCQQLRDTDTGLLTRSFTGLGMLPTLVAKEVHDELRHELMARIPRSKMGKGAFAYGSLVKVISRQGLNIVDIDQHRCFISNRWSHIPDELKHEYPAYGWMMKDPEEACSWIAVEGKVENPKRLVIICSNLEEPLTMKGVVGAYLNKLIAETVKMAEYFTTTHPGLLEKFADHEKPLVSAMAALDWHWEQEVTNRFDSQKCSNIFRKGGS